MKGRNYVCQPLIGSKIIAKNKNQKEIKFEKKLDHLPGPFMVHVISSNSKEESQRLGWEGLRRGRIFLIISYTKSGLENTMHAASFFCQFHYFFYIIKSMSLPNIIYYSELRTWNVFSSRFVFSFNSSRKKTKTANNENSNGVQLLATN